MKPHLEIPFRKKISTPPTRDNGARIPPGTQDANVIPLCAVFLLFTLHPRLCFSLVKRRASPEANVHTHRRQPLTSLNHVYSARLRYREAPLQRLLKSTLMHACIIITAAHRPCTSMRARARRTRDLITHRGESTMITDPVATDEV